MAVKTPELEISPYQSSVPMLQIPPEQIGGIPPAQPLQGQFGGKHGTPALAIGDALLKGLMQGHAYKEQKKLAQTQATIAAADASTEAAYSKYQDALVKAGGDVNNPEAKSAYDAYLGVFNQSKQAKAQFVIPDKGKGGQKSSQSAQSKDGKKKDGGMLGGIKEFFEANPHVVPQIALLAMQPKAPGLSRESNTQMLQDQALKQDVEAGKQNIEIGKQNLQLNDQRLKENAEAQQRAALERRVEESGGIENVLKDKDASPELKQTASRMKYEALDKESPEGRLKMQMLQDVQSGQSKNWTPQQRMMAGILGAAPPLQEQTITGKNGHQQQVLIDPMTNQPVAGSKPLDLGPPQWAQEFYAKQAADKRELQKAVEGDPAGWGVTLTGDAKTDKARMDAKVSELFVRASFGIQSLASQFGRTGYEVQRDNDQLQSLVKSLGLNAKNSPLDSSPPPITFDVDIKGQDGNIIKAGTPIPVGSGYMANILHEFVTRPSENAGVMAYRDTPLNPDGKSPEALEGERKFLYQYVKNHLITQKGKLAMTEAQADAFLKNTALGKPISSKPAESSGQTKVAGVEPPPQAPKRGLHVGPFGIPTFGIEPPPQVGQQQAEVKLYMIPGVNGPVRLSGDDLAKLKANNIPVEELSADLMNQFLGK